MPKDKMYIHPNRNVKDSEHMEQIWLKFKDHVRDQANEWIKTEYVGKDGERRETPQKVPLTFEGFKRFCYEGGIGTVEQYFTNQDGDYDEFLGVCSRIKTEIRENQIVGGMLGFFNPSITQRLNGLVDKKQTEVKGEPRVFNVNDDDEDK